MDVRKLQSSSKRVVLVGILIFGASLPPIAASRASTIDFVAAFASANLPTETGSLDLASPSSDASLRVGFYPGSPNDPGGARWSEGERSAIEIHIATPAKRRLILTGTPLQYDEAPPQSIRIHLNGAFVAERRMDRKARRVTVEIPANRQRVGANLLELRYSDVRRPIDVVAGSLDQRRLAVAWESLRVDRVSEDAAAAVDDAAAAAPVRVEGEAIVLPPGGFLVHHARLGPGAALRIASLRMLDGAGRPAAANAALTVIVETDEEGRILERTIDGPEEMSAPIAIPVSGDRIARVTLVGSPSGRGASGDGAVELRGVVLESRSADESASKAERSQESLRFPRANIVLYVIDTLRAGHLGAYGHPEPVSPRFDALASEGILFENSFAVASWTRPAMASIFTGIYPNRHGVVGRVSKLAPEAETLAEQLEAAGYRTRGDFTNGNLAPLFGLNQGFEQYQRYFYAKDQADQADRSSVLATRAALEWIVEGDRSRPFFAYVHVADPHGPYEPPSRERKRFASQVPRSEVGSQPFLLALKRFEVLGSDALRADLTSLYDAEIAYTDARLGDFLDGLDAAGHGEDTLVVVTSDHGEEFFDHGWFEHGRTLYGEQLRVPLVVRLPGRKLAGSRVSTPVEQVDLMPTLLELVGLEAPRSIDGRSRVAALAGFDVPPAPHFASLDLDGLRVDSVTERGLKLIEARDYATSNHDHPSLQLFDLETDPGEEHDLAIERPIAVGYLLTKIRAFERRAALGLESDEAVLDADLEEELRALGYIE